MAYEGISKRRFQTKACISAAKLFLFLFNIIFWVKERWEGSHNLSLLSCVWFQVNGLILLLVGFWMRMSITKYFDISREYHFAFPAIFMVTGVAIIIIGFFACSQYQEYYINLIFRWYINLMFVTVKFNIELFILNF